MTTNLNIWASKKSFISIFNFLNTVLKIRKATRSDFEDIFKLICELAEYEKLPPPDKNARKRLFRDAFSKKPLYKILIAENKKVIIGYAFYYFTYSSFLASKTLYLEDIYVVPEFRFKGIGKLFLNKLTDIAKKKQCGRMEWCVLNWNKPAIRFYEKLGAKPLNEWTYYRLTL